MTCSAGRQACLPADLRIRASVVARSAAARAAATAAAARGIVAATLAAAPAVLDALRIGQLVAEAAFQASAQARELRRVEAQVLLLRHLDRDRLERLQERRAAQRTTARAV